MNASIVRPIAERAVGRNPRYKIPCKRRRDARGRFTKRSGAKTGYRRWRPALRERWDMVFGRLTEAHAERLAALMTRRTGTLEHVLGVRR